MRFFIIAILAAFCFSGFGSAAKGYLDSCHHFDVHGLDGKSGREVRMYAECKNINDEYVKTNLDLNTCFEWANCGLSYPGKYDPPRSAGAIYLGLREGQVFQEHELMRVSNRDFSSTCNECDNPWQHEDQFGTKFGE